MNRPTYLIPALLLFTLVGCANPEVVQVSPGVYMLSAEDKGGIFGNSARMKADVIRRADEFAANRGKVAIPVTTNETPMHFGHFATFDYQFRLVDKNSPEANVATTLGPMPSVVIQKTEQKIDANIQTKDNSEHPRDIYAELEKLDGLRKKGVITEDEFQAQKKILAGN
ncbi:MAG TPA: SHOCT domain-containing protein [Holophagaceae bacterium]|jgi:hypothetical protein|nr:SHOCT domain-containing protein [Holophagaceae bacterium]